jgi:alpha-beta hydrolase superfamily lysophospholipase
MSQTIRTRDGLDLFRRDWPSDKARGTIVIVHGLGEHVERYSHVAANLNERGWRVVGCDHRGHGRSPGDRGRLAADDDLLADLSRVIDAVRVDFVGDPLVLLGHSLGGLVAARFVAGGVESPTRDWHRDVDALALSSPALGVAMTALQRALLNVLGPLAPDLAVSNGLAPGSVSRSAETVSTYGSDPLVHDRVTARLTRFIVDSGELVRRLAPHWTVPTLLLYAGSDRCVLPSASAAFAAAAPPDVVTAREFPGLFHEIFNEPEQAEVLSVLGAWLDTLPLSPPTRTPR